MSIQHAFIVPHPPLIVPEIGKGEEKKIQSTIRAYDKIARMIAEIKPDTVIVASPHSVMYGDYIHISPGTNAEGDFGNFGATEVRIKKAYDTEFVGVLLDVAQRAGINAGTLGEKDASIDHGALVPLYFLEKYFSDYQLVRVSASGLPFLEHYRFGQCIAKTADMLGRKVVLIASGDLSHRLTADGPYGYADEGPVFDAKVTEAMKTGDFLQLLQFDETLCEAAGECGLRCFIEMAGALDGKAVQSELFSYEGPFGVGYAVCGFSITGNDENRRFAQKYEQEQRKHLETIQSNESEYVYLARLSLETYVKTRKYTKPSDELPKDMHKKRAGVFVSLKQNGRLRGCIGTIVPTAPSIAQEIIKNAVSAGTGDPRFDPVTEDELNCLVYSVDVLGEPEAIESMDELDVRRYGVIVTKGYRQGLLLPNLDGVTTPEQQVAIALQKAGISSDKQYEMQRFEVVRYK